jgi:ribosomal protein S18 acetylase RimI-like enzyme
MSSFQLPVIGPGAKGSTPAELLLRSLHAETIFEGTLGEQIMLDCGVAFIGDDLPLIHMAHQVRDVRLPEGMSAEQAVAEVNAEFAKHNARCHTWNFVGGKADPRIQAALGDEYQLLASDLWTLVEPKAEHRRADLTIVPGRSSFAALGQLHHDCALVEPWGTPDVAEQLGIVAQQVLDDPRVDCILALQNGAPVGSVHLAVAGELGLIESLDVHPDFRRQGIGMTLLERVIELAARSRLRQVTLFCMAANGGARALYRAAGFVPIGAAEYLKLREN